MFVGGGEVFAHLDGTEEAAIILADGDDFGAVALDQLDAFLAHPIGHENLDGVTKHAAESGKGDTSIATGGLGDSVAGLDLAFCIGLLEDAESHAVFDTTGEAKVFGFGVEKTVAAVVTELDTEERGVADEAAEGFEFRCGGIE